MVTAWSQPIITALGASTLATGFPENIISRVMTDLKMNSYDGIHCTEFPATVLKKRQNSEKNRCFFLLSKQSIKRRLERAQV